METTGFFRKMWVPPLRTGAKAKGANVQVANDSNLLWHCPKKLVWYFTETATSNRIFTG